MHPITEWLGVLGRTAVHFSHSTSEQEIFDHALAAMTQVTGAPRASLLLFDPDGVLRFKAWRGISDKYRAAVEGHTPWVPGQREPAPIVVPDASKDPSLGKYQAEILAEGIRSLAFFPLVTASGTIGKVMVYWEREHELLQEHIELLRALSSLTAFAIDRKRAVDQLEIERRLFIGGPSVVFKWQNRPTWPVDYVSPNCEQVLGYTPAQLRSEDLAYSSLVHPDDVARVATEVVTFCGEGRPWFEQEYRLRRADGEYRWFYDFTVPIRSSSGETTHFHGYLVDETERRDALDALSQRQRVESLGVMAGGVAHDFNNLLVGVMGNAGLALQLLSPDMAATAYVRDVVTAAQRASELTRKLLAYSGKAAFSLASIDVAQLVRECVRLLASVISPRATVEIALGDQLRAKADATQLRQIVINLLTNASDALGGKEGTIRISSRSVELAASRDVFAPTGQALDAGKYVLLEIEDTGVGMDETTLRRVFDPFFTTKGQGHGLGLSAVLGIVRAHHGAVNVTSRPGQGSAFQLYFPASDATPETVQDGAMKPSLPDRALRVLVVDDDDSVRTLVHRALELEGHEPTPVAAAQAALDKLAATPDGWDVVLMDLTMPRMSGLEALSRIRERSATLPVIIMSGYNSEGVAVPTDDPATSFLEKPFRVTNLLHALDRAVKRDG